MDLLARRDHSRAELSRKLHQTFSSAHGLIEDQLQQLAEEGLQSDARMVESFVRARVGRGQGPVKITVELAQRGIDGQLIRAALDGGGVDWIDLARRACLKRFGDDVPTTPRERAKRMRFLSQRGFRAEHIRALFS